MRGTGVFLSNSDEWATPEEFFKKLNTEFNFTLDPCCTIENKKCRKYYTKNEDGLKHSWGGERVYCNPPYSNISMWVEKAYRESQQDNTLVVLLIPVRTDTKYFHNFILNRAEIRFIKGRLKFSDGKNSAPFPSMLIIYRGAYIDK